MPNHILNDLISFFTCPFSFFPYFTNSFVYFIQTFIYSSTQSIESVSHWLSTLTVPSETALCHPFSLSCFISLLSMCLCQTYSTFICYVASLFRSGRIPCLFCSLLFSQSPLCAWHKWGLQYIFVGVNSIFKNVPDVHGLLMWSLRFLFQAIFLFLFVGWICLCFYITECGKKVISICY